MHRSKELMSNSFVIPDTSEYLVIPPLSCKLPSTLESRLEGPS